MTNYILSDEQQNFLSSQFGEDGVGDGIDFICVLNNFLLEELAVQEAEIVLLRGELEKNSCTIATP